MLDKMKNKIAHFLTKFGRDEKYKIFKCKRCGRRVRVPRGKKRIEVTCPVCGDKSKHYT